MTDEQKEQVQFGIDYATKKIVHIEAETTSSHEQWELMDKQLLLMLDDLVEALPKALRQQAKICLEKRNQVRKTCYAALDASLA